MAIFCQINQKNQLVDPNVLYSFDGYQKKGIDPNISGKNLFISIINPAVKVIHKVNKTGAVDKYF